MNNQRKDISQAVILKFSPFHFSKVNDAWRALSEKRAKRKYLNSNLCETRWYVLIQNSLSRFLAYLVWPWCNNTDMKVKNAKKISSSLQDIRIHILLFGRSIRNLWLSGKDEPQRVWKQTHWTRLSQPSSIFIMTISRYLFHVPFF